MYDITKLNSRNVYIIPGQKGEWTFCSITNNGVKCEYLFSRPSLAGKPHQKKLSLNAEQAKRVFEKIEWDDPDWDYRALQGKVHNLEAFNGM